MQLCQFWGWGVIFVFWLSSTVSAVANGRPPALVPSDAVCHLPNCALAYIPMFLVIVLIIRNW